MGKNCGNTQIVVKNLIEVKKHIYAHDPPILRHLEISSANLHTRTWKISGDLEIYRT